MLQKKYKSELISVLNPFEGIYTLEFRSLGKGFKYQPGQFLHLATDVDYDGIDQWPESRCFSMQSNPNEETIRITYSVKGNFTKRMEHSLNAGSQVWLKLPYGDLFSQTHNKEKSVFIAGGTGITPFLSLFTHESFIGYKDPHIYLGFRSDAFNIYKEELARLNNSTHILKTYNQDSDGVIDIEQIFSMNGKSSNYFISGPPAMIKSFKQTLIELGVPKEYILSDDWE